MARHRFIAESLAAGVASLLLGLSPVWAADEEESGQPGVLGELVDQATYEAESYLSWFPQTQPPADSRHIDDTAVEWWNQLTVSSNAMLADALFLNFEAYAAYSTQQGEMRGVVHLPGSRDVQPPFVGFTSLFVRYEAPGYELTVGKDFINIGVAEIYSPTDLFGQATAANPQHPRELGQWQLRLDYFVDADTLSMHVIPFEKHPFVPTGASRWLGAEGGGTFTSLNLPAGFQSIDSHYHNRTPENFGYLARYQGFREGYDFFGLAYHGPSPYPVLRLDTAQLKTEEIYPLASIAGGGISAVEGRWKVYGEALVQIADLERDQDLFRYMLGVSYRENDWASKLGLEEIQPIVEYAGEHVLHEQRAEDYSINSYNARLNKDSVLTRLVIKQDEEFKYTFGYTKNLTDKDYSYALGIEYKPDYNTTFRLQGALFGGKLDTQLGRWRRNDYIEVGVSHKF